MARVSTLVTLHLPDQMTIKPPLAGLEVTVPDRMELERTDRIARLVTEFIAQIDRSSGRERERAAALLIAHEMSLRSAERSLRWSARLGDRIPRERAERDLEVIKSTRMALLETLRAAAMDEEIDAARNYFGLLRKGSEWNSCCRAGTAWPGSTSQPGMAIVLDRVVLRLERAADKNQRLAREREFRR